jgi:hypothetical protein
MRRSIGQLAGLALGLVLSLAPARSLLAQSSGVHPVPAPHVAAVERRGAIVIDGRITEAAWNDATPITDFTQVDPDQGKPASQGTEVRILYDADAIYVAARMHDSAGPGGINTHLTRRDQDFGSDYFHIILDSYHDHLGRAIFQVNPSGVKSDALDQGGFGADDGWDPVWEAATSIDSTGWSAEMRIPFSQLRFKRDSEQTWGVQLRRYVARRHEETIWAYWTKTEAGGPSRFGHLEGLHIAAQPHHVEVLPYVVSRARYLEPAGPGDPFNDGSLRDIRGGADVKALLTTNLTLDATINPDFGQVESDPAVVNLTAFETFLQERRPFFIEGSGIFGFGGFSCFFCSNTSSIETFYSRRIGRSPQGNANGDWVDAPENSTILGAAKITGRTGNGFSVGVLDAVTRKEMASVIDTAQPGSPLRKFDTQVEPFTNYFVGRVRRDLRGGDLVVGGIATSVVRDLSDSVLSTRLDRHAEVLGSDVIWAWKKKTYSLMASTAFSNIAGDTNAIRRAQYSPARYFQRPDRKNGDNGLFSRGLDPNATALRGYAGYARLAKDVGNWMWETSANIRSPGYEPNDLAFLSRADYKWMSANLFRYWTKPTKYYRNLALIGGSQQQFNYDGDRTDRQFHGYLGAELANFWNVSTFYIQRPESFDDRQTRGGPVVRVPKRTFVALNVNTDSRRSVVVSFNPNVSRNTDGGRGYSLSANVTVKPVSNVNVSLGPAVDFADARAQFVTSGADSTAALFYGRRYIFSNLKQRDLSMETRVNVTFTPTLSLEMYAQPFIASAAFYNYKQYDRPRGLQKTAFTPTEITQASRVYTVDVDGAGPAQPISFDNPDFTERSLRGNAVLRWEYRPGSTLFLVWSQSRDDFSADGDLVYSRDRSALFKAHPNNVFLLKASYWLGR